MKEIKFEDIFNRKGRKLKKVGGLIEIIVEVPNHENRLKQELEKIKEDELRYRIVNATYLNFSTGERGSKIHGTSQTPEEKQIGDRVLYQIQLYRK